MSVEQFAEWQKKRDEALASKASQSKQNTASDQAGQTPTEVDETGILVGILEVLTRTRVKPFTTKSDFARKAATIIGLCASDGLITTRIDESTVSNTWIVTQEGMAALEEISNVLSD